MRTRPQRQSFERFYLEKVALGEGCGCAEHATRMRDLDRYESGAAIHSGRPLLPASTGRFLDWLTGMAARAGIRLRN